MTEHQDSASVCLSGRLTLVFYLTKPTKYLQIRPQFLIGTPNVSHFFVTHRKQSSTPNSNRDKFAFYRFAILAVDPGTLNSRNYDLASGRPTYDQGLSGAPRNMN